MDRRLALLALWAMFAAAAVGAGFGAAGLVGQPFTDGFDDTAVTRGLGTTPSDPAPETPAPRSSTPTPSAGTATARPTGSASPTASPRPSRSATPAPATVARTLATRAGVVSARCRGEVARLGASPAIGWEIVSLDPAGRETRVRFEEVGDGEDRVEVRTTCVGGRPRFAVDDDRESDDEHSDESDSGDGSDGGSDD